jgi:hypothetical protein
MINGVAGWLVIYPESIAGVVRQLDVKVITMTDFHSVGD